MISRLDFSVGIPYNRIQEQSYSSLGICEPYYHSSEYCIIGVL